MEESRAVARRADDLVRRCYSGLRGTEFQAEVVRAVHALLPVDAVFLATADPGTLLFTGVFAEEPLVGVADQFLANEFGEDDVNKFQSLATGARHVATLDSATRGERAGSARFRDIMAPIGLGDELRAALVTPSGCWGYLCLHRAESPYGFTPAEVRLIARLAENLGNGCRLSLAPRGAKGSPPLFPGSSSCIPTTLLAAITGEAQRLLAGIADYSASGRPAADCHLLRSSVPAEHRPWDSRTWGLADGAGADCQRWLATRPRHALHGSVDDDIAVIIESAHPSSTAPLVLSSLGLTPSGIRGRTAGAARGIHQGNRRRAAPVRVHGQRSSEVDLRQDRRTQSA